MLPYVKNNTIRYQFGMALITVLIFLQLLAMLSLYALEASWLEMKMSRNTWQYHEASIAAENALNKVEDKLMQQTSNCLITVTSSNELLSRPLTWWQSIACTGQFNLLRYYYVIEDLEEDSCADVRQDKEVAHYYRVTLLSVSKKISDQRILLQSTVIKQDNAKEACAEDHHTVSIGRQMWRELKKE